ncbi:MAG: YidC/Oxa1 family membrane protein insertase, partial [Candidatus Saccharimonadales bacterium]
MNIFDILIVQPIFNLLVGLYSVIPGGDFGIAIIIFTILIRFAMYPLVKKQLHQVKKMRVLQPELERIKKQTKGNKQQYGLLAMELYKKHDVSPFRTIGILIIQLPIFIALYHVIQILTQQHDKIAKYTYSFLENIPAIEQIIKHPDELNQKLFGLFDLTKHAFNGNDIDLFLVLLAIVAAATQFIMSKQTMPHSGAKRSLKDILSDASAGKEADQSEINTIIMGKMIYVLPFFMLFIMLNLPGAIALYYA